MPSVTIPTVARTYRAAIKVGEDYVTLEETVTLPIDASDDAIAQAVQLGMRIYAAQHDALNSQVATIRADADAAPVPAITLRDPDAPASAKQRTYLAQLQAQLGWSDDQLTHYTSAHQTNLATLTKGQASTLIEHLKQPSAETQPHAAAQRPPPATTDEAAQRFYDRYAEQIDGSDWAAVQRFVRQPRLPQPTTIDGWYKAARQVQNARRRAPTRAAA